MQLNETHSTSKLHISHIYILQRPYFNSRVNLNILYIHICMHVNCEGLITINYDSCMHGQCVCWKRWPVACSVLNSASLVPSPTSARAMHSLFYVARVVWVETIYISAQGLTVQLVFQYMQRSSILAEYVLIISRVQTCIMKKSPHMMT